MPTYFIKHQSIASFKGSKSNPSCTSESVPDQRQGTCSNLFSFFSRVYAYKHNYMYIRIGSLIYKPIYFYPSLPDRFGFSRCTVEYSNHTQGSNQLIKPLNRTKFRNSKIHTHNYTSIFYIYYKHTLQRQKHYTNIKGEKRQIIFIGI